MCPKCRGSIKFSGDGFICYECDLKYPFREDIPIMLIDSAMPLKNDNDL